MNWNVHALHPTRRSKGSFCYIEEYILIYEIISNKWDMNDCCHVQLLMSYCFCFFRFHIDICIDEVTLPAFDSKTKVHEVHENAQARSNLCMLFSEFKAGLHARQWQHPNLAKMHYFLYYVLYSAG